MKYTLLFIFYILSFQAIAQAGDVMNEIDDAFEYYEDAFNKAQSGLSYIQDAFNDGTVDGAKWEASNAEGEISSAKLRAGYAEDHASDVEDEANNIDCDDVADKAGDAEDYFYSAKRALSNAESELSNASYEDDADYLSSYLNNARDYITKALRDLNYGVDELNKAIRALNNCAGGSIASRGNNSSCENLMDFVKSKGYKKGSVGTYTLDSEWLSEVTAYTYDYKLFVIAKIKTKNSYYPKPYIFCDIPSSKWSSFKNVGYGESDSYGKRFHDNIFDYKCNCN